MVTWDPHSTPTEYGCVPVVGRVYGEVECVGGGVVEGEKGGCRRSEGVDPVHDAAHALRLRTTRTTSPSAPSAGTGRPQAAAGPAMTFTIRTVSTS